MTQSFPLLEKRGESRKIFIIKQKTLIDRCDTFIEYNLSPVIWTIQRFPRYLWGFNGAVTHHYNNTKKVCATSFKGLIISVVKQAAVLSPVQEASPRISRVTTVEQILLIKGYLHNGSEIL
jgi:hypothetical protein